MAKCDEGYICEVCNEEVSGIINSDLYLRFVIGKIDPEVLHTTPERHIRCNPGLAQFIVHPLFESVTVEGDFAKVNLDPEFVREQEELVTRGYQRLLDLRKNDLPIVEYPLPEVIEAHRNRT